MITANDRAARTLNSAYAAEQRTAGRWAWKTPPIYSWDAWLDKLWEQHLLSVDEAPLLLSNLQERSVWKRIVEARAASSPTSETIARLASEAWALLSDFEAHSERHHSWSSFASSDAEAFRHWAASFEYECRTRNWVSRSDLPNLLVKSIQQCNIELPTEIILVGFDRITPAASTLLGEIRAGGCPVNLPEPAEPAGNAQMVQAGDLRDELSTCAWWMRSVLAANPTAHIAVISQNVEEIRGEIDRTFRGVLMPEALGIESSTRMPFEFSLGHPLSSVAVIKAALLLLKWLTTPLDQNEVTWLLLSGFIGAHHDATQMATLDVELRKYGRLPPQLPLSSVAAFKPRTHSETIHRFLHRLHGMERLATAEEVGRRSRTAAEFVELSNSLLKEAAWPGSRTLDSAEYQALDRWDRLTVDIAKLSFDERRYTYAEFVTMMDHYSGETLFSPESHDAPIQIMGAFESSGQTFDAIWFLGADDNQLPVTEPPHPLLPLGLQHRTRMPHGSPDIDWEVGLAVIERIAGSAPECNFSYSQRNSSGELRPSVLPAQAIPQSSSWLASKEFRISLGVIEPHLHMDHTVMVADSPFIPWPKELTAGGADILRMQSACPFQAFASRRLGAKPLDDAERGLDAIDRGNILHRVLESLWSKETPVYPPLKTRDDLINAKAGGYLSAILEHHIDNAFRDYSSSSGHEEWALAYHRIEKERLHFRLSQWLDYEMKRPPFTVEEQEKTTKPQINGLQLNLRVDRIDQVDGGHIIVDYKTGDVSTARWRGDRPDEPQLPLYAIHGGIPDLVGVLFAQIRAGDVGFKGHVANNTITVTYDSKHQVSFVKTPLDENLVDEWSQALSNLADQFLAGDASVAPKSYPKTCRYCELPSLCRVAETAVTRQPVEEAYDDESVIGNSGTTPR